VLLRCYVIAVTMATTFLVPAHAYVRFSTMYHLFSVTEPVWRWFRRLLRMAYNFWTLPTTVSRLYQLEW